MVGTIGLEPTTFSMSRRRANHYAMFLFRGCPWRIRTSSARIKISRTACYTKGQSSLVDRRGVEPRLKRCERPVLPLSLSARLEMPRDPGLEPGVVCTCDGVFPASAPALLELVALTGHLPSELEDGYVAHPLLAGSSAFVTAKRTAMHHASPVPSSWWTDGGSNPDMRHAMAPCCRYHYRPSEKWSLVVVARHPSPESRDLQSRDRL